MSDETETAPVADELGLLKQRAKLMGLTFSGNIGLEALKEKVAAHLAQAETPAQEEPETQPTPPADEKLNPLAGDVAGQTPARKKSLRQQQLDEQLALIRVRITNMDPKKKELPGEVFCVGNEIIGMIRKYVPYGEHSENGYHLPMILYNELNERKFLNIRTVKNKQTGGTPQVKTSWAKEFAFEVLPPLTQEELDRLAIAQAAAGSIESE